MRLRMVRRLWQRAGGLLQSPTLRNLFYLYAVQVANFLFPLITLPYLARVLGPEGFGKLALAQALAQYLYVLLEYGFSLSATREVARKRNDPEELKKILSGVLGARFLLLVPSIGASIGAWLYLPNLKGETVLVGGALLWAFGFSLSPVWFFQGLERMALVAFVEFLTRLTATLAIFLLIKTPSQVAWPLYIQAAASFSVGLVGLVLAVRLVGFSWWEFRNAHSWLRRGLGLLVFRVTVSLYTIGNVLLVGLFLSPAQVALYAGAERIARTLTAMWDPFNRLFLPRFAHLREQKSNAASRLATRVVGTMVVLGLSGALLLILLAPWVVQFLLGKGYEGAVPLVRILAWLLPLVGFSNFLGMQWMLANKMDRPFNAVIALGGVQNMLLALFFIPRFGAQAMAWVVVYTEAWVALALLSYLWRKGQLPWGRHDG